MARSSLACLLLAAAAHLSLAFTARVQLQSPPSPPPPKTRVQLSAFKLPDWPDLGQAGSKSRKKPTLPPVIICPAQFGTAADYAGLREALLAAGHPAVSVAPLTRAGWLRIVPSALTAAYWKGELTVSPALEFYLEAIDAAVEEVSAVCGAECDVVMLGHSIGGWVMRGYLAEPSRASRVLPRVKVAATLGTPNRTPPEGTLWASADQTRGLLKSVNAEWRALGPTRRPPTTLCVIGTGTEARLPSWLPWGSPEAVPVWDPEAGRSPLLEAVVALASYLALAGIGPGGTGDGLIPVEAAAVDLGDLGGAASSGPGMSGRQSEVQVLELPGCNHAGFVPTPGASLQLPDTYAWYGSPKMLSLWLPAVQAAAARRR